MIERESDDIAVTLCTVGTTGQPKSAKLTRANLSRNVESRSPICFG
jgi:long-subunit acyl-CoA synthetase (AMP-forming)